jgi:hypothetical protein
MYESLFRAARLLTPPPVTHASFAFSRAPARRSSRTEGFLIELTLDDSSQPIPGPTKITNLYFAMPPSGGTSWVSAFFSQSTNRVGVYLRFTKGNFADRAYESLQEQRAEIEEAIGIDITWDDTRRSIISSMPVSDVFDPGRRSEIGDFFSDIRHGQSVCKRIQAAARKNLGRDHVMKDGFVQQ